MTFWVWARRATDCATLLWRDWPSRAANPQLWPAPSLNWPGRRLPFRRLSFLPYRTPRHLITTLCFEGNLGEFFTIFLGDEPSHPTLQQDYFFFRMRNLKTHLTRTEPISVLVHSCYPVFSALTVGACPWSDLNRRLPTALQERLTTNAQRTKKYFSFSCAPLSTLHIYYITKFEKCQIFKSD